MNKFAGVLLSACLMSGSASWGLCKAVENCINNNPARALKVAIFIGWPLASATSNVINAFKKSAEAKKVIWETLTKSAASSSDNKVRKAPKLHDSLTNAERDIKNSIILHSFLGLIHGCVWTTLVGDPIIGAGISIFYAASITNIDIKILNDRSDKCFETLSIPRMPH